MGRIKEQPMRAMTLWIPLAVVLVACGGDNADRVDADATATRSVELAELAEARGQDNPRATSAAAQPASDDADADREARPQSLEEAMPVPTDSEHEFALHEHTAIGLDGHWSSAGMVRGVTAYFLSSDFPADEDTVLDFMRVDCVEYETEESARVALNRNVSSGSAILEESIEHQIEQIGDQSSAVTGIWISDDGSESHSTDIWFRFGTLACYYTVLHDATFWVDDIHQLIIDALSSPESPDLQTIAASNSSSSSASDTFFGDGTFIVGEDIQPGTYRNSDSSNLCYWERLSGFGGTGDEIIANGVSHEIQIVTISSSDVGFSSTDCGSWTRTGS